MLRVVLQRATRVQVSHRKQALTARVRTCNRVHKVFPASELVLDAKLQSFKATVLRTGDLDAARVLAFHREHESTAVASGSQQRL